MSAWESAFLVGAAIVGGAMNSVAGGGTFFTFPALVAAGVPIVQANATSTLALCPGYLASAVAYRRDMRDIREELLWLGVAGIVGGAGGALLLVFTPPSIFEALVPFLLLLATLLFAFDDRIKAALRSRGLRSRLPLPAEAGVQVLISVYGGYFGGGMGMVMLAAYSLLGMKNLHRMEGINAFASVLINAAAIATFAWAHLIRWPYGLLMVCGALLGGYGGAAIGRRTKTSRLRAVVVVLGFLLSVGFFARAFLRT
jgi:uncharacterized membrane protein YfcA